jgi:hypothetical protein
MTQALESFDALVRRFADDPEDPGEIARVDFAEAVRLGRDPLDVIAYLARLGRPVTTLDQLVDAINADEGEEELHAHRVAEGVAVSVASSGAWILFQA